MNELAVRIAAGWLSALLLAGCARSNEPAAHPAGEKTNAGAARAGAEAPAGPFVFDWAPPCRVPVSERVLKNGKAALMSYDVSVRSAEGGGFSVFLEDLEFVELGGERVTPKMREQLQPILELAKAIPAFHLSKDGRYAGCEDFGALAERMIQELAMPPERANEFRKTLANPHTRAAIEQSIGNYWSTWVESWIGWDLAPGASSSNETSVDVVGSPVPARVDREYRSFEGGHATLHQTTTYDGQRAAAALLGLTRKKAEELGASEEASEEVDPSVIRDQKLWIQLDVETRPQSLKPRFTRFERLFEFSLDGEKDSNSELREVTWHWDRAEGCVSR